MKERLFQVIGVAGTAACLIIFALQPSWPTPDKLLIFLALIFMVFRHAKQLLARLLPFVGLLLVYETFRGLVPHINHRVEFQWMVDVDIWMFGGLPTAILQDWLWHGQVQWFDMAIYLVYMLHFVLPLVLALVIWKYREKLYWQFVTSFVVVSFAGFLTFLAFPAAPPWMAAQNGTIQPIERISSHVWAALGVEDFPSLYNRISPNPVAAVPSLHAAYATLIALFIFKLFGWRWGLLSLLYPAIIYFGTVYQGEHYFIDELLGGLYAVGAYWLAQRLITTKRLSKWSRWTSHFRSINLARKFQFLPSRSDK